MTTEKSQERDSDAVLVLDIAKKWSEFFFLDSTGRVYAWVNRGTKSEPLSKAVQIGSKEFRSLLASQFYWLHQRVTSRESISAAIQVLEAKAYENKEVYNLKVRYNLVDRPHLKFKQIEIDTSDIDCKQIVISKSDIADDSKQPSADRQQDSERDLSVDADADTADTVLSRGGAVEVVGQTKPTFRRFSHMQPLVHMAIHGTIKDVEEFAKFFKLKDERDSVLLAGFIGASMISEIPHSILLVIGSQGASKTTLCGALKMLIDPSSVQFVQISDDERETIQALSHHYLSVIDNSSMISRAPLIDILCKIVTGMSFSKRSLYSDDEDSIFSFQHVLVINGINVPNHRGDFLDRCLILELARIPTNERKTKRQVEIFLAQIIPKVLAATYKALSKALGIVDEVEQELEGKFPRLADFGVWGEAFCRGLGYPPNTFFNRFLEKTREASRVSIETDILAELLMHLVDSKSEGIWQGTSTQLVRDIHKADIELGTGFTDDLPSTPRAITSWLNNLEVDLKAEGYSIDRKRVGHSGGRIITITKGESENALADAIEKARREEEEGEGSKEITQEPSASSASSAQARPEREKTADDMLTHNSDRQQLPPDFPLPPPGFHIEYFQGKANAWGCDKCTGIIKPGGLKQTKTHLESVHGEVQKS